MNAHPGSRYTYLNTVATWLRRTGALQALSGIPRATRPGPSERVVPEAEFEAAMKTGTPTERLLLLLAHDEGLRAGTIARMTRENCDLEKRELRGSTKLGAGYAVPMTARVYEQIAFAWAAAQPGETILGAISFRRKAINHKSVQELVRNARSPARRGPPHLRAHPRRPKGAAAPVAQKPQYNNVVPRRHRRRHRRPGHRATNTGKGKSLMTEKTSTRETIESLVGYPVELLPTPALNVKRCFLAMAKAAAYADEKNLDPEEKRDLAQEAYKMNLPALDGRAAITANIACVAHGIAVGVIDGATASKLLYAAQVALTLTRQKAREKRSKK